MIKLDSTPGKHGMSVKRSRPHSPNSFSVWQLLTTLISRVKRSLLWSSMTGPMQLQVWMMQDGIFRLQTEAVWCNTNYSVCPQTTFKAWVKPLSLDLSQKLTGDGVCKATRGRYIGQTVHHAVAASFQELTRCGYRKDFCGRFKCLRSGLNCTASFV